ncbi:glucose-6-phosphate dehydrogenase [Microbacterium sp. 10M-3C3]|jgi:glucose-6-phosphate 1-dehydrogenase|uniref:glucose-6-phosphate dehydrogenase n=1 Tax=Microbacterium sp. 10M-3C3 TaxID=2483401 RepID=UPI000F63840B|nr:glucose-6-phosphate dehydrogenase [Microbacterium sp. 10M-3C3]
MAADTTTLLILGASGDLTSRLLLPALGQLLTREPGRRIRLRGAGLEDIADEKWREIVRTSFATTDSAAAFDLVSDTTYTAADITAEHDLASLLADTPGRVVLYFAVPPAVAEKACAALTRIDVPEGLILALEKPFGSDEASAHALNETLQRIVPESQVFRIDHFLGRSTTLNLIGVRLANRLIEPVWSAEHIESVLIRYDETLGLEGRAGYYDHAGALVDMIQSHLLQVLAILAMEPPATLSEVDFRDATAAVLRATHVWGDDPVGSSRRARYTAGTIGGRALPSYVDEPGVDAANQTETLAEMTCEVRTERWSGVPITLRSGKALDDADREVIVRFRPVRHLPDGLTGSTTPSVLRFSLGPDRVALELNLNGGDDPFELERASLEADLGDGALKAYAEVLSGLLDGDATLAVRGDAAEQCWRIVQPVIDAWRAGEVPLDEYSAGSDGPSAWPAQPEGTLKRS